MEAQRRLTLEELDERHPKLIPALRAHPHVGWLLVRSAEQGPVVLGAARGATTSPTAGSRATIRSAAFSPGAPGHLLRTDGFATSPTSWSAASTTRSSTRAAPSRS